MNVPDIPKELLHIILEYDGRIKYQFYKGYKKYMTNYVYTHATPYK
jgi:hypothetical protein